MRLELRRTGGFAGIQLHVTVDTVNLGADRADEFDELVGRLNLGELSAASGEASRGADRRHYHITIDRDGVVWSGSFPEDRVPDQLGPLVARLLREARHRQRGSSP